MFDGKEAVKNLLRKYNLSPNFTYGQNFLTDETVLEEMVEVAGVSKQDTVLEIGPGIGNLTRLLCEKAGFVFSVEKDPKFFPILKSIKKEYIENFWFEIADILEFDFGEALKDRGINAAADINSDPQLYQRTKSANESDSRSFADSNKIRKFGSGYKVVANIPYYITGKILQLFLTAKNKPESITVLIQKEVAKNATAGVGDLNILGISVQMYGEPKLVRVVPAESFYPAPKVDSAILHVDLLKKSKLKISDEKNFFKVVKACFVGKRKQIHNTLTNNLHLEKEAVLKMLQELKISPSARPQEISVEKWVELADKVSNSQRTNDT